MTAAFKMYLVGYDVEDAKKSLLRDYDDACHYAEDRGLNVFSVRCNVDYDTITREEIC